MGAKILIVDNDQQVRKLLRATLKVHGFTLIEASNGQSGLLQTATERPDLVLLDSDLPDMPGLQTLCEMREWYAAPIIVMSVRDVEQEKVLALDHGADDFVTKPFNIGELTARIRVALRHAARQSNTSVLHIGPLSIDLEARMVKRDSNPVQFTPIEYDLFKALAIQAGHVVTHEQLIQLIWKEQNSDASSHYLRVYIGHLRRKLEENPAHPRFIITVPGVGYRLIDPSVSN